MNQAQVMRIQNAVRELDKAREMLKEAENEFADAINIADLETKTTDELVHELKKRHVWDVMCVPMGRSKVECVTRPVDFEDATRACGVSAKVGLVL